MIYLVHFCFLNSYLKLPISQKANIVTGVQRKLKVWDSLQIAGIKIKGRISKRVLQENKVCQIFRKITFLTPCVYEKVRNVRFSENLACFVFL